MKTDFSLSRGLAKIANIPTEDFNALVTRFRRKDGAARMSTRALMLGSITDASSSGNRASRSSASGTIGWKAVFRVPSSRSKNWQSA